MSDIIFREQDLTIIIPTLGRDMDLLATILGNLRAQSRLISIIIVWDSNESIDDNQANLYSATFSCEFICHPHNKGLSAARNTGITNIQTPLGMFLDDDIIPQQNTVAQVIAFHNQNPQDLVMQIGKVTWQGGEYQSKLTNWFETYGNWSVLVSSVDLTKLSNFMGGFTSFKRSDFNSLKFDESFKKYGCEDIEFGYRFFSAGGCLYFCENIVGIHNKRLTLDVYYKEHVSAGYSKGVMSELHPDICFDTNYLLAACRKSYNEETLDCFLSLCSQALLSDDHPAEVDFFMGIITEQAMYKGYIEYYGEQYPAFGAAIKSILNQNSKNGLNSSSFYGLLPNSAPLKVEQAMTCENLPQKKELLEKAIHLNPAFARPYLELTKLDLEKWKPTLRDFFSRYAERLDSRTTLNVQQTLGDENVLIARDESPRALFFEVVEQKENWSDEKTISQCLDILKKDPTFVAAYIVLIEKSYLKNIDLAKTWLSQARYFLKFRPLTERTEKSSKLNQLEQLLKDNPQ